MHQTVPPTPKMNGHHVPMPVQTPPPTTDGYWTDYTAKLAAEMFDEGGYLDRVMRDREQ